MTRSPFSWRFGTSGGGSGGGAPRTFCSTHLPRTTGEVRFGSAVTVRTAPLPEDAAARTVGGQRDALEVDALHVGNVVVRRQPLVHERVVGVEQIDERPILAHDAVEEELGFPLERPRQRVAVVRVEERVRHDVDQPPQRQPLPREVDGEGPRPRIGQHPPHLLFEHRRIPQLVRVGEVEQLVVGPAAPQEERQARRERQVADRGTTRRAPTAGANSARKRNDGLTRMRCRPSSMPVSKVPLARPSA